MAALPGRPSRAADPGNTFAAPASRRLKFSAIKASASRAGAVCKPPTATTPLRPDRRSATATTKAVVGRVLRTQDVGTSPTTPGLWVAGGIEAANFTQRSDHTLKTDVAPIDAVEARAAFDALRPLRYRLIDNDDRLRWGMIADDVADAIPDAVSTNDDGLRGYDIVQVLAVTVAELASGES